MSLFRASEKIAFHGVINGLSQCSATYPCLLDKLFVGNLVPLLERISLRVAPSKCLAEHISREPYHSPRVEGEADIEELVGDIGGVAPWLCKPRKLRFFWSWQPFWIGWLGIAFRHKKL